MHFASVVSNKDQHLNSRVLVWSLRNIQNFVYNSCLFEFEDIIADVDSVDIYSPPQFDLPGKVIKRLVKTQAQQFKPLVYTNPYRQSYELEQDYDIFFTILDFPVSISSLNSLKNLRKKSKFAVCYIVEIWNKDLPKIKHFLEFFNNFDLILVGHSNVAENVTKITGVPCEYLAPGVNAAKFYPDLNQNRSIDICSLGRRSPVTHKALLDLAEQKKAFYYYDTNGGAGTRNDYYQEYRTFISNLLKNSRYFITNHAKINQPERTDGQQEIGYRFFEGAAAGSVLIGKPPQIESFKHYFDWPNAVIPMEFDEPDIADLIAHLDSQTALLKEIRVNNVINSLRKHDWVYRWEQILDTLSLPPMPAMANRKSHLEQLARACAPSQSKVTPPINHSEMSALLEC